MARGDQLGRQWKIIQELLTARQGKSAAELAEGLECHPRTVYRDLEALQVAGFPVFTDRRAGKNVWRLLYTAQNQIPIPFSLTELMALYFSRGMMKVLKNTVFYDSLESLFSKIKTMLSPEYRGYLDRVENSVEVGQLPHKSYGEYGDIIAAVNEATVQRRYLDIEYFAMSRKQKTHRKIAPYKVWFFDGTFYLIGYCLLRRDVRIFVIDRIRKVQLSPDTFEIPEHFDFKEFMKFRFGVFDGKPTRVIIRFSPDIAGYIREKIWHASQEIEAQEDGSILFRVEVAGTDEIKFWIMQWGSGARVLAPESLKTDILSEIEAMRTQLFSGSLTTRSGQSLSLRRRRACTFTRPD